MYIRTLLVAGAQVKLHSEVRSEVSSEVVDRYQDAAGCCTG